MGVKGTPRGVSVVVMNSLLDGIERRVGSVALACPILVDSHRYRTISTTRVLKISRDLIGSRAARDGEETLLRTVQVCKRGSALAGENC